MVYMLHPSHLLHTYQCYVGGWSPISKMPYPHFKNTTSGYVSTPKAGRIAVRDTPQQPLHLPPYVSFPRFCPRRLDNPYIDLLSIVIHHKG